MRLSKKKQPWAVRLEICKGRGSRDTLADNQNQNQNRNQTETLATQANDITACAPNRRRVAATCFASITHGATCRWGTGHKVQVGVGYEKLGVGHYFLTR